MFFRIFFFFLIFLGFVQGQFKADLAPALGPQFRAGIPSYFFLYLKPLPGFSLPTQGKVNLIVMLNGIAFSQEFFLESPPGGPYLLSLLIPPKITSCQLFFQGALEGEQTTTLLPSPYPTRNRLGGMFTRLSRQSSWQSIFNTTRSQVYAFNPKSFPLPDFRFLESFDFFVLDELAPDILSPKWQEHLFSWLIWGGSIVLTEEVLTHPFLDQISLPPADIFEWENRLGDQLKWDSWKISPEKEVFWSDQKPYLISYSFGLGKILILHHERAKNYPQLSDQILPLLSRVPLSLVRPQAFLPFEREPAIFSGLIYISLGIVFLYGLSLYGWGKGVKKYCIVAGFIFITLLFYGVFGKEPIRYQEASLSWVSAKGEKRWQCLFQLTSTRSAVCSFEKKESQKEPMNTLFPLFYEARDFRFAEQETRSLSQIKEKKLFWEFQFSPYSLKNIPLQPSWNYIFEQRGSGTRSTRVAYKGGLLHNPTPHSFGPLLFWKAGDWFYLEQFTSGAVLPLPSAEKSVESLVHKLRPVEVRLFHFLQKSIPSDATEWVLGFESESLALAKEIPGFPVARVSAFIFE